jgi:two-component system, OmpR family, phosphate regulon sensor histidine kinase PhoR
MATTHDRAEERGSRWIDRLVRTRLVLAAAAIVFAGLWVVGALTIMPALVGFLVIAIAALAASAGRETRAVLFPLPNPPSQAEEGEERARAGEASEAVGAEPLIDAVLAGLPDPVVALDARGDVVAFNAQASAVAPALRRGGPISLALRVPEVLEAIRRAQAGGGVQRAEFSQRVPQERWYEAIATPIAARAAAPDLLLLALHDLSPLRRVEEMRADFIANASHELRTPLAALAGFIDTLKGPAKEDAPARARFLDIMQGQADRMARLIDDLLSLSRIELSAHLRPDQEIDLVAIVRQVIDGLQTLARDRGVAIELAAPAAAPRVLGDRDELLRVFENLLENALKYAASGKRVEVAFALGEAVDGKREARVAVRDHGPGIAPEHLPRLTERFYRVDVAESRAQGGTGLGLALVKHILNRHGGRLTIESTLGRGATFTVHLPVIDAPLSNAYPRPHPEERA